MSPTSPILLYTLDGTTSLDVLVQEDSAWLTIDQIALLFGKSRSTINEHILHIFEEGELAQNDVLRKIGISDNSTKPTNYYNLNMILAVGYRVKSKQGIAFRTRATQKLKDYLTQGFVLNEEKLRSGKTTEYFDKLQARLREIRLSERLFYQKIKDIYTTSIDYDSSDERTLQFFKIVQNKLLRAISKQTAAELVYTRIDGDLPFLGMKSYDKSSELQISKQDISIAKNYLNEEEIAVLGLLVEQYLAFAESMAQAQIPMKMTDWIERLDAVLQLNQKDILTHAGSISHDLAVQKAVIEYDKFRSHNIQEDRQSSLLELERDLQSL